MNRLISFPTILLNPLSSSCNSLRSENICCMLQQRNSMMIRNITTQKWNQATGAGMNRYISWITSKLRWFWPLRSLWWLIGATMFPVFGSSDKTHLTHYSGNKIEWPVYFSLGKIDLTIRWKHSNLARILLAHLPVPRKYHVEGHGFTTPVIKLQIHNQEVVRKVLENIFCPVNTHFNTGKLMLCVDSWMRQCYSVICAWMAD